MGSAKQEALRLVDALPEETTWEEILYNHEEGGSRYQSGR